MTEIERLERKKAMLTRRLERIRAQKQKETTKFNELKKETQILLQQKKELKV